jgi:hypothetical protein
MTEHDRIRMVRAQDCDQNDLQSIKDALLGLQSTDDPSLLPLYVQKKLIHDCYKGPKSRATFEAYEVMWIEITGSCRSEEESFKMMAFDDGGLISELQEFMKKEKVMPLKITNHSGGKFGALFPVQSGEKVMEWLKANGAIQSGNYSGG